MSILHDIEQTIRRIEADISHMVALRKQHMQTETAHVLSEVDNKIAGLKGWVEDIKQALHAGAAKIDKTAAEVKAEIEKI